MLLGGSLRFCGGGKCRPTCMWLLNMFIFERRQYWFKVLFLWCEFWDYTWKGSKSKMSNTTSRQWQHQSFYFFYFLSLNLGFSVILARMSVPNTSGPFTIWCSFINTVDVRGLTNFVCKSCSMSGRYLQIWQ